MKVALHPSIAPCLRGHQVEGASFLLQRLLSDESHDYEKNANLPVTGAILADEMGTGKVSLDLSETEQALALICFSDFSNLLLFMRPDHFRNIVASLQIFHVSNFFPFILDLDNDSGSLDSMSAMPLQGYCSLSHISHQ